MECASLHRVHYSMTSHVAFAVTMQASRALGLVTINAEISSGQKLKLMTVFLIGYFLQIVISCDPGHSVL